MKARGMRMINKMVLQPAAFKISTMAARQREREFSLMMRRSGMT
jgi:hypothetical protein